MTQPQIILIISIIIAGSLSFYPGLVMAWLFGNFFPGIGGPNASTTALFLWKAFHILLLWTVATFLLKSVITFVARFFN